MQRLFDFLPHEYKQPAVYRIARAPEAVDIIESFVKEYKRATSWLNTQQKHNGSKELLSKAMNLVASATTSPDLVDEHGMSPVLTSYLRIVYRETGHHDMT